jgi:hypothetical protein
MSVASTKGYATYPVGSTESDACRSVAACQFGVITVGAVPVVEYRGGLYLFRVLWKQFRKRVSHDLSEHVQKPWIFFDVEATHSLAMLCTWHAALESHVKKLSQIVVVVNLLNWGRCLILVTRGRRRGLRSHISLHLGRIGAGLLNHESI